MNWISQHQALVWSLGTFLGTWLFNNVITVMVSSLPAPSKYSSEKYNYWFKVANTIIGNLARAKSTIIEQSPNWRDAIDLHVQRNDLVPAVDKNKPQ